ncbi:hypothetical protein Y032_0633g890 [Ancylostoma ceylanicum]|uniref:SCP domain-containing protein n=2 Tax=Ancylostoma ceylanicum TaxID=53326 RepID=A0A016WK84_9BILA|nr:hypothetical protein Y032_0633g890 [Ancylostoma ceylanicum]
MCPNNGYIMADGLRKTFVNLHNNHRLNLVNNLVANGNSGQKLRSGSKMMLIKYDCDAEKRAFEYAKQCKDADSDSASRHNWAENRYTFPNKNLDPNTVATRASNRWWNEIASFTLDQTTNIFRANTPITHFVKMAWDTHESIGCAIYHCPSFINAVCHYGPAGQFGAGKQIYKPGPKCNRCGTVGATCFGGLCRR